MRTSDKDFTLLLLDISKMLKAFERTHKHNSIGAFIQLLDNEDMSKDGELWQYNGTDFDNFETLKITVIPKTRRNENVPNCATRNAFSEST